jgi:prepilin-type N-terminal cleavage/methylation domain-containing protein/prepilin-type processing-associated H-X9-DG protein
MKTKKAFTLVELLVVIAIIGLLLSILMPALSRVREMAKRTICTSNVKQIGTAIASYAADYDDLLPFYGGWDPAYKGAFSGKAKDEGHPYAVYRADKDPWIGPPLVAMKLACLAEGGYSSDGKVFYCPSNKDPQFMYQSYVKPLAPNTSSKWGTLPQAYNVGKNQWVRVGYAYYPIDKAIRNVPPFTGMTREQGRWFPTVTARKLGRVTRNAPYLTDVIWSKEDITHRAGSKKVNGKTVLNKAGVNALFADGHTYFVPDQSVIVDGKACTLFDNPYWDDWERTVDDKMSAGLLFYNIYSLIKP